jgi:hypothetical protein
MCKYFPRFFCAQFFYSAEPIYANTMIANPTSVSTVAMYSCISLFISHYLSEANYTRQRRACYELAHIYCIKQNLLTVAPL